MLERLTSVVAATPAMSVVENVRRSIMLILPRLGYSNRILAIIGNGEAGTRVPASPSRYGAWMESRLVPSVSTSAQATLAPVDATSTSISARTTRFIMSFVTSFALETRSERGGKQDETATRHDATSGVVVPS